VRIHRSDAPIASSRVDLAIRRDEHRETCGPDAGVLVEGKLFVSNGNMLAHNQST